MVMKRTHAGLCQWIPITGVNLPWLFFLMHNKMQLLPIKTGRSRDKQHRDDQGE